MPNAARLSTAVLAACLLLPAGCQLAAARSLVDVDLIDPIVDKNLKPDGVGPDGRIEHRLKKDFT